MKGGLQWKEGSDTCIFKPSVACKEDPITYPSDIPNMISRVVKKTEPDIANEKLIRDNFPDLVKRGIVSVFQTECTPQFIEGNRNVSNSITYSGPCMKRPASVYLSNLITPEYTDSFRSYIKTNNIGSLRAIQLLRGAICAAIELVPDNKVWVIHGDLHLNNVLVKQDLEAKERESQTYTALADWGRMITFNSADVESVYYGLARFLHLQSMKFGPFSSYKKILDDPGIRSGRYTQYSGTLLTALHNFMVAYEAGSMTDALFKKTLAVLRGFMPYILTKQLLAYYRKNMSWTKMMELNSQQELIDFVNEKLPKLVGEDYYSKRFVNKETRTYPSEPLSLNLGGGKQKTGKRKTRKQKRRKAKSLKRRA